MRKRIEIIAGRACCACEVCRAGRWAGWLKPSDWKPAAATSPDWKPRRAVGRGPRPVVVAR